VPGCNTAGAGALSRDPHNSSEHGQCSFSRADSEAWQDRDIEFGRNKQAGPFLMPTVTLNPNDVANAQLGINLPVIYGFVRGQGNEVLNHTLSNKNRIVGRILSEGEIDGIDRLYINSALANAADTTLVHFHPGVDGTLGVGLNPQSTGRPPGAVNGNLIINGDGESGVVGSQAANWLLASGNGLLVANDFAHSGVNSLKIINGASADSFSFEDITVVDGGTYRLQGWIMTTAIAASAGHGTLFNVDILNGVTSFTIISKTGSNFTSAQPDVGIFADGAAHGWTFVSCVFQVHGTGLLRVYCQLGFGVGLVGTAWFDDLQIALIDQDVDSFWSLLPANFIPTTYSRKAYLMLNVPPDAAAPSATLTVVADFRGCKVRQFDNAGNQTGYAFSTNGAEQCLDVILRTMLKPEWNPIAAAAPGGDLVAAEKARINWPSYANAVAWCNGILSGGQKRFESSLAIVQQTAAMDVLTQLCLMSQLYITESAGQIYICADQPRTSTFLLTTDHILSGMASFDKINLHGANNRLIGSFNDLNAQDMADLDTPANSALVRSGSGVVTAKFLTAHPFQIAQNIQIVPPQDGSTHDTGFDGVFPVASIPLTNEITYAQNGHANWLLWSEDFTNVAWTKETGVTVTGNTTVDPLGGNTADTLANGTTANSGVFQVLTINSTNGVPFTGSIWMMAAVNTVVTIQINRSGGSAGLDIETVNVSVTPAWQRFTFTHSATWTGASTVAIAILVVSASTSVFIWGAQLEDGAAPTTYRQTTNATNGVVSGNGYAGTPESRFALRGPVVDHEQHQNATGQRGLSLTPIFHVSPITIDFGNNTFERVTRLLNFLAARTLGIRTTPYIAPWSGTVTCYMDAVDTSIPGNPRALISQLCGDIITIDATVSEEYQADYEIRDAVYTVPAANGTSSDGTQQSGPTIELTLLQYLPAAFSDTVVLGPALRVSAPIGIVPIGKVDNLGIIRLKGTFNNNPVNTTGTFTGSNPLSQSGTTTTINVASSTTQFGDGQVSYNSGSVNPGAFGAWFVTADDLSFQGGAVPYAARSTKSDQVANNARVSFGQITTAGGGGGTGTGGGGAGCFSGNTKVRVSNMHEGFTLLSFDELTGDFIRIEIEGGSRSARKHTRKYSGWMYDMGDGELVTPEHLIKITSGFYDAARTIWSERVWYQGNVHTLETITDVDAERHFILGNGRTAHNISPGL
jgi:hypothetical protein